MSGGRSSSSNSTSSSSSTVDSKMTADGEAVVARADGGDVIVNQTLDEAVVIAQDAFATVDNAVGANEQAFYDALKFAEGTVARSYELQRSSLDEVAYQSDRALDSVVQGFQTAAQENRSENQQLLSQLITFGIPAIIIFMIWRAST